MALKLAPKHISKWRKDPKRIHKYQFIHHFLPDPESNKRATLLSHKAVLLYCLSMLFIAAFFRILPTVLPGVLGYASDITANDLLKYTNSRRESADVPGLKLNSELNDAAKNKAQDMFKDQYWAHVSPSGKEPWDFILAQNYDYIYAGENLAKNFNTSRDVVEAWMKSPSHRENLLSPNYSEVGFAVVNGVLDGYETTLVVQMFGKLRNSGQVASVYEEKTPVEQQAGSTSFEAQQPVAKPQPANINEMPPTPVETVTLKEVQPFLDVTSATKIISALVGGFVGALLVADIVYSRKRGILKFTGHTFAHLSMLALVLVSIWFLLTPGIVL